MRKVKGLSNDGPFEERALEENGNAAGNGADYRGGICGTGVICGEDAGALGNALGALDTNTNADAADKKHDAFNTRPVEWIDMFRYERVEKERRPENQCVEGDRNGNEGCTKHGLRERFSNQGERVKENSKGG
jgi:hypothetical protein